MEANQYHKVYSSLSNRGADVRKADGWDEFFEPAYYSPVYPGDIPAEIPEFTTSELGINHPMDTFKKDVPQYFVLVIDNVGEFENGEVFVDTQGYDYIRYGYGIRKPEPIEEIEQTEEAYHIGDNKEIIKKEMKETRVTPDNHVAYLANALQHVWNMGKGNNTIDYKSMAQSLVNDMFGEESTPEIPMFKGTKAELDDLFEAEYFKRQWQHRAGIIK